MKNTEISEWFNSLTKEQIKELGENIPGGIRYFCLSAGMITEDELTPLQKEDWHIFENLGD